MSGDWVILSLASLDDCATQVDFAWTERLWQSPGSRVLASTKPEIWAPVSKQKSPQNSSSIVDDKSVVVMIRYTTNIEAAAATKWVSSFHCKNCLKLPDDAAQYIPILFTLKI